MMKLFFSILFMLPLLDIVAQKASSVYPFQVLKPANHTDSLDLARECEFRRLQLGKQIGEGVLVMSNNKETQNNFYYLNGWAQEPSACILEFRPEPMLTLFIKENTPMSIIWNGQEPGPEEVRTMGAQSHNYYEFKKYLKQIWKSNRPLYVLSNDKVVKDLLKEINGGNVDSSRISFFDDLVEEMRIFKSPYEISCLSQAVDITVQGLKNAYKAAQKATYEYEIAAIINLEYARNGQKESFTSIVGSGKNATTLHYEANNCKIDHNQLLLMDVGAFYRGYAADITRTIPADGKFNQKQLLLYNLVLKAQQEGIKVMKPGNKILDFHIKCVDVLSKGLYNLGFITDSTKSWQKELFILYQSGHYVGLDVHDAGRYMNNKNGYTRVTDKVRGRDLVPGMILTIEPGIYINPDMLTYIYEIYGQTVPIAELDTYVNKVKPLFQEYANIGIRIEDDILITEEGNRVLSDGITKDPIEIEKFMKLK